MSPEVQDLTIFSVGVILSAFFSGSEAAIISIPSKRVKQMLDEQPRSRGTLLFLQNNPSELLTTILIGNNFVNIFVASLATRIAQRYLESDALSYSVGITTILILIFGEIIPKTFMRNHSERLLVPITRVLQACYYLLYPVVKIFMLIIESVLGEHASLQEKMITKDDIEFMVGEAERDKSIDSKQIDLLTSILEFPTIKVKDIMTPRSEVHVIQHDAVFGDIVAMVKEVQHSRYPIVEDDLDKTLGFIHVKDLVFASKEEKENLDLDNFKKEPFFVYEHMKIQAVFDHMNRKKVHLSLVKDENGLVVGIVTLEDIMEEIFGEIQDEHDDEDDMIAKNIEETLEDGITLPGSISLRDLDSEFDIKIPLNDNYSTLRGFLLDMLGNNFPKEGNILFWQGLSFELVKVIENEIEEVKIESTDGERHISDRRDDDEQALEASISEDIQTANLKA